METTSTEDNILHQHIQQLNKWPYFVTFSVDNLSAMPLIEDIGDLLLVLLYCQLMLVNFGFYFLLFSFLGNYG